MNTKRTADLAPGDRVQIPFLRNGVHVVRTVDRVTPWMYRDRKDGKPTTQVIGMTGLPLYQVWYREGRDGQWSDANTTHLDEEWTMAG